MASAALVRPLRSVAWELRGAWASGRRVSLNIDGDVERVEGWVSTVSPTDGFCRVRGLHVPLDRVMAVHHPSRLGDSTVKGREPWMGRARRDVPQVEALWDA